MEYHVRSEQLTLAFTGVGIDAGSTYAGMRSYCVDRWPPADEIAREIEEMPL